MASSDIATARWDFPLWKAFHKGKSHLALALALETLQKSISVYFTTVSQLVEELRRAHHVNRLNAKIKQYLRPRILVIDEVGYLPVDPLEPDLSTH